MIAAFFRELRRRRVTRTCVLYILICWGVLQVGDIIYPALGLDADMASLTFLYLAFVGFPVTFAIAWFFQITPQGIVRTNAFVERRVLDNVPPVNDRRRGLKRYFRKEDETLDYRWILTAESGPLAGLSFGISDDLVIGRSLDCDIAVVSPVVSRQHARLALDGELLTVEDLGSANGTMVNGKLIEQRHYLRNDDEVAFQDVVFRVSESYRPPDRELESMDQTTFIRTPDIEEQEALARARQDRNAEAKD